MLRLCCRCKTLTLRPLIPAKRPTPLRYDESTVRTIQVTTPGVQYPVYLGSGLLPQVASRLRKFTAPNSRIFIVTSPEIWALWGKKLLSGFGESVPEVLFLPAGEAHKRMASVEKLATALSESGADRSSLLIAFGGGILGDLTGFLAAIYMRGIDYVQIPTTLLAQVDSSVGGKTGANLSTGKNLIGSFHHPRAVFADVDVLHTLPPRELRAGLQECVKAGIIRDAALFRYMERNAETILAADDAALTRVIAAAVRMKADVVARDEREGGLRMILNYGHTLGHAIETVTHYRGLLHGEAVGWGMLAATELSRMRGLLTAAQAERIQRVILTYGPLPRFRAKAETLLEATARDKKNRAGTRRFVLAEKIGQAAIVEDITEAELRTVIAWLLQQLREVGQ
jgi:3-dehydroquinate synthase